MALVVIPYPPIEIGGFKMIDVLIAQVGFNRTRRIPIGRDEMFENKKLHN